MTFPSDGSFVPVFTSPDDATMESDPEAGTSTTDTTDGESVAAGVSLFCLTPPCQPSLSVPCMLLQTPSLASGNDDFQDLRVSVEH